MSSRSYTCSWCRAAPRRRSRRSDRRLVAPVAGAARRFGRAVAATIPSAARAGAVHECSRSGSAAAANTSRRSRSIIGPSSPWRIARHRFSLRSALLEPVGTRCSRRGRARPARSLRRSGKTGVACFLLALAGTVRAQLGSSQGVSNPAKPRGALHADARQYRITRRKRIVAIGPRGADSRTWRQSVDRHRCLRSLGGHGALLNKPKAVLLEHPA